MSVKNKVAVILLMIHGFGLLKMGIGTIIIGNNTSGYDTPIGIAFTVIGTLLILISLIVIVVSKKARGTEHTSVAVGTGTIAQQQYNSEPKANYATKKQRVSGEPKGKQQRSTKFTLAMSILLPIIAAAFFIVHFIINNQAEIGNEEQYSYWASAVAIVVLVAFFGFLSWHLTLKRRAKTAAILQQGPPIKTHLYNAMVNMFTEGGGGGGLVAHGFNYYVGSEGAKENKCMAFADKVIASGFNHITHSFFAGAPSILDKFSMDGKSRMLILIDAIKQKLVVLTLHPPWGISTTKGNMVLDNQVYNFTDIKSVNADMSTSKWAHYQHEKTTIREMLDKTLATKTFSVELKTYVDELYIEFTTADNRVWRYDYIKKGFLNAIGRMVNAPMGYDETSKAVAQYMDHCLSIYMALQSIM